MAKRVRPKLDDEKTSYFADEKKGYKLCIFRLHALWIVPLVVGSHLVRIVNIVGDKSTAKTALATEALINFISAYPDGVPAYRDTESAFDQPYAEAMGLPLEKVDFGPEEPLVTVEQFTRDFDKFPG